MKQDLHEDMLTRALFGALEDEPEAAAHLAACPACAAEYRALRGVLDATAHRARPEPPPAFWDGYADRLAERMAAEEAHAWSGRLSRWRGRLAEAAAALVRPVPAWTWQLGVAVLLVGLGIVIGRGGAQEPVSEGPSFEATPAVRPVALETRTRRYIDRSKVLLLGLVHYDPDVEGADLLDLPRHQALARTLADEADGLKEDLAEAEQQRLRELVADLEVILLQIANLEAQHDLPAIELVRSGVERRGLLLKINVEEMRLAAPTTPPAAPKRDTPTV